MGLGKTLTVLALVMNSAENVHRPPQQRSDSYKWLECQPTLIVMPLSGRSMIKPGKCYSPLNTLVLGAWEEQIRR